MDLAVLTHKSPSSVTTMPRIGLSGEPAGKSQFRKRSPARHPKRPLSVPIQRRADLSSYNARTDLPDNAEAFGIFWNWPRFSRRTVPSLKPSHTPPLRAGEIAEIASDRKS